jgi:hypothetical protein
MGGINESYALRVIEAGLALVEEEGAEEAARSYGLA